MSKINKFTEMIIFAVLDDQKRRTAKNNNLLEKLMNLNEIQGQRILENIIFWVIFKYWG